jgi:hypothetical protein
MSHQNEISGEEPFDTLESRFRLDRSHVEICDSFEDAERRDRAYWHSRTPEERLLYLEHLRRMNYGRAAVERLQSVLEIVERS